MDLDELMGIIKEGANLTNSIANVALASAKVDNLTGKETRIALLKDKIADENTFAKENLKDLRSMLDTSLTNIKNNEQELDNLNFDWKFFLNEVAEEERTDDMKAIFEEGWDGKVKEYSKNLRIGEDNLEKQTMLRGSIDFNNYFDRKMNLLLDDIKKGKQQWKDIKDEAGIKGIVDYGDFAAKVKNNPKYQAAPDIIKQFQENVMGLKEGDPGYGIFGPKTSSLYEGPTISDPGPDGVYGTDDDSDINIPLSPEGVGLMEGSPDFEGHLELMNSLQNLEAKTLLNESRTGRLSSSEIDDKWWDIADDDIRNMKKQVSSIKPSTEYEAILGINPGQVWDIDSTNKMEDLQLLKEDTGKGILRAARWGMKQKSLSYDEKLWAIVSGGTSGGVDYSEKTEEDRLIALYNYIMPTEKTKREDISESGMLNKFKEELDFAGMGDVGEVNQQHFVRTLNLYKLYYDKETSYVEFKKDKINQTPLVTPTPIAKISNSQKALINKQYPGTFSPLGDLNVTEEELKAIIDVVL